MTATNKVFYPPSKENIWPNFMLNSSHPAPDSIFVQITSYVRKLELNTNQYVFIPVVRTYSSGFSSKDYHAPSFIAQHIHECFLVDKFYKINPNLIPADLNEPYPIYIPDPDPTPEDVRLKRLYNIF